jgi:hypothetical protein
VTRDLPIGKGVDLIDDEEIEAVTAVLRDRRLFRYQSRRAPSRVADARSSARARCRCSPKSTTR